MNFEQPNLNQNEKKEKDEKDKGITRREFLKNAAKLGGALAVGSALGMTIGKSEIAKKISDAMTENQLKANKEKKEEVERHGEKKGVVGDAVIMEKIKKNGTPQTQVLGGGQVVMTPGTDEYILRVKINDEIINVHVRSNIDFNNFKENEIVKIKYDLYDGKIKSARLIEN